MGLPQVSKAILMTPIGQVKLEVTDLGLKQVQLSNSVNDEILTELQRPCTRVEETIGPDSNMLQCVVEWMFSFFDESREPMPLPPIDNLIVAKSNFTGLVLRTLMHEIPFGDKLSYAELALRCGSPKACRAVGQAMRANPIPLVVPCHRVVGSNGKLGHYMSGKGNNIKSWLLEMEKRRSKDQPSLKI